MSTGQNQLRGDPYAHAATRVAMPGRTRWSRLVLRTVATTRGRWWVFAFPLLLYLTIGAVDSLSMQRLLSGELLSADIRWNPAVDPDPEAKYAAEVSKQKYQILAYLWVLALIVGRTRSLVGFLRAERWLVLVFGVLSLTALSTDVPERVFANMVHLTFGFLVVWVYLFDSQPRRDLVWSVSTVLALPTAFAIAASLFVFFVNPRGGLEFLADGQRFGGVAGGPNALGGVALLGTVGAVGLMMAATAGRATRILATALLGMAGLALATSGSATSSSLAALAVAAVPLRLVYRRASQQGRIAIIMLGAAALLILPMVAIVQDSVGEVAAGATEALGKDTELTGRVDLWMAALDAFEARPVLGWGYDNHETVLAEPAFTIPHVQYHNGYLDNLVVGGTALGIAILCCFGAFAGRAARGAVRGLDVALFVVAFAVAALHNVTEYSLFRAGTSVFMLWLLGYVGLQMQVRPSRHPDPTRALKRRRRAKGRPRSRKRMSWR